MISHLSGGKGLLGGFFVQVSQSASFFGNDGDGAVIVNSV